jgi:hypothetical protein
MGKICQSYRQNGFWQLRAKPFVDSGFASITGKITVRWEAFPGSATNSSSKLLIPSAIGLFPGCLCLLVCLLLNLQAFF